MKNEFASKTLQLVSYGVPANIARIIASKDKEKLLCAEKAIRLVGNWYNSQPKDLLVMSGPGNSGKTMAACMYLSQPMKAKNPNRADGQWQADDAPKFLSYLELQAIEFDQFKPLSAPGTLVIDDLGAGLSEGNMIKSLIFALVQQRTFNGVITIITTRQTPADLSKRYGARFGQLIKMYGTILTL